MNNEIHEIIKILMRLLGDLRAAKTDENRERISTLIVALSHELQHLVSKEGYPDE